MNGFIAEGTSIFPRVEDCIHFHYESISYNYIQVVLQLFFTVNVNLKKVFGKSY